MIVVADTSPLIALVNIEQVTVLQQLFQEIVIPPAVAAELGDSRRPIPVGNFVDEHTSEIRSSACSSHGITISANTARPSIVVWEQHCRTLMPRIGDHPKLNLLG